jgi:hypothetical protein
MTSSPRGRLSSFVPSGPRSILLSDELKEALRRRGQELGVGYQTAAEMILAKYVNAKLYRAPGVGVWRKTDKTAPWKLRTLAGAERRRACFEGG